VNNGNNFVENLGFFSMYVGIWLKRVAMSTSYVRAQGQCQTLEQLLSSRTTCSDNNDGSRVDYGDCKDVDV